MHCFPDICYKSKVCDLTDEIDILSSFAGQAFGQCKNKEMKGDLLKILNLTYILMGKLRDNCDFFKEDKLILKEIKIRYEKKGGKIKNHVFILPQGGLLAGNLHICRALSKKISRMFSKAKSEITFEACEIEETVSMLSDIFYNMALCVNYENNVEEIPVILIPERK
ncbi:cobalamin adenosyltransferase [uncultured Ilyobacter sp.]|uniref:cobalamin adenosyltransferase n=1 Tax=uncultured Ilyobacter sp. TaxID=544433 RepID=UPI002AA76459|nr:cobalamin adenosyltransferase [uncultured Ilyobacter sp.]